MISTKVNFVHLCEYASLSDGKLNVLGVFEGLTSPGFPIIFPQLYVVTNLTFLETSEEEVTQEIQILSPNGDVVSKYPVSFPVMESNKRIGTIGQLNNVSFKEAGQYKLKVFIDGIEVKSEDLQIERQ